MKKIILITIILAQTQIFAAEDSTVKIKAMNFCKQKAFDLFKIKPISGDAQAKIAHNKSICVGLYCFSKVIRGEWLTFRCENDQCVKQNLNGQIKVTQDSPIFVKRNSSDNELVVNCQKNGYASEIRVTIDDFGIMFNEVAPNTRHYGRIDFKPDPYTQNIPNYSTQNQLGITVGPSQKNLPVFRVNQYQKQASAPSYEEKPATNLPR